jgi:integrase
VKVDNARKGFFEPADFAAVEANLPATLRPYVCFLYLTGWRAGEARGLTWADVNFDARVVRLEPGTTKNGAGREFPFAALQPLADLLRQQHDLTRELARGSDNRSRFSSEGQADQVLRPGLSVCGHEAHRAQDRSRVPSLCDHIAHRPLRRRYEALGAPWRSARFAERDPIREGHSSGTIRGITSGQPSRNELSKWFQQAKF